MRSFRSVYFEKAYSLLSKFIVDSGRRDEQLESFLEDRDVDGLIAWANSHEGDALAGPIRLFASGIMLDETLDRLSSSADELRATTELGLHQDEDVYEPGQSLSEQAILLLANTPSARWIH